MTGWENNDEQITVIATAANRNTRMTTSPAMGEMLLATPSMPKTDVSVNDFLLLRTPRRSHHTRNVPITASQIRTAAAMAGRFCPASNSAKAL